VFRVHVSHSLLPLGRIAAGVKTGNGKQGSIVIDDENTE
jgi:hypothetical protein